MRTRHFQQKIVRGLPIVALLAFSVTSFASDIRVYVDGEMVRFDGQGPRMMSDRVVVPLRGVFERLGASVDWRENDQSIMCTKGSKTIWLQIGEPEAKMDGTSIHLDQPAVLYRGTTMVPLRFVSEGLGASVSWNDSLQAVNITTADGTFGNNNNNNNNNNGNNNNNRNNNNNNNYQEVVLNTGTVVPLKLDTKLSSESALEGDKFTATVDTNGRTDYAGLPRGTTVVGHVSMAKAKTDKDPGVLGLEYDALVVPDGTRYPIRGSMIGLDNKSVKTEGDRIVAKSVKSDNDHKSVWIGAGAGAVLAVITKGNILTDTVIGAALGYLYETLNIGKSSRPMEATLDRGTAFGVKLEQDLIARIGS